MFFNYEINSSMILEMIFIYFILFNHIYTDNNLRVQAQNTIVQIKSVKSKKQKKKEKNVYKNKKYK